ncbi:MAG: hypothetical protein WC049_07225, partial [Candidatus Ratteibacteria bacterium]
AKSIFLWCGEVFEQWRGWLPYWGFCSKNVRTSSKKHRSAGSAPLAFDTFGVGHSLEILPLRRIA